ncbi:MAG: cryptochrome/photolyase family protein [Gammaproteobacteria bacterium]|nr:cryptochrome/photolyase family protein [Gammaproteobacteria bacterium]
MAPDIQIILGNQLFPLKYLPSPKRAVVFMAEDVSLCTYVRHHKKKLVLFLAAMRNYADGLRAAGYDVRYHTLEDGDESSYEEKLAAALDRTDAKQIRIFEIEDGFMQRRILDWAKRERIDLTIEASPMFLCDRKCFAEFLRSTESPRMADFYREQRRRMGLLVDESGAPTGGRWSFDADNRKKLPASIDPPPISRPPPQKHVATVTHLVEQRFADHPGSADEFWLPVTREAAIAFLNDFLGQRFEYFGPYEDAISQRSRTLFHSLLSPSLNLGLITPDEVIEKAVRYAEEHSIPLNSLEGFVRQIAGWREFVRGIYQNFAERQEASNFWNHHRRLTDSWYRGETGVSPLDDAIRNAWELGWDHHIARLMIVGNLMNLCEIEPSEVHRWFMEMYVDSSDWVMGPNVYGMALFSDGGIFATKPYICGSNYLLKMSDYRRGEWCDVVDGLYWRFIEKHAVFFSANPRLSMMPRSLARLKPERKSKIFDAAERFLEEHTRC